MSELDFKKNQAGSILVVDDESLFLENIYALFPINYKLHTAKNLESAWKMLKTNKIDCIFCDLNLKSGQNGIELLKLCRSNGMNMPFILMSGYLDVKKSVHAFRSGATDVLEKPISPEFLSTQLNGYLKSVNKKAL